jgi:hypothetical protein
LSLAEVVMSGLWYVKLPDGDVEPLTLDELDEAFQAGHVSAHTMVLAAGSTQWARLGELAGLDQPPPQRMAPVPQALPPALPPPLQRAAYVPIMPSSLRPVSVDLSDFGDDDLSFRPKKSKKWMFGVAVVAGVLGFAAFQAQRSGVISVNRLMAMISPQSTQAVAAAPIQAPAPPPPAAPAPSPDPAPTTAPAPSSTSTDNTLANRFSADVREKLAAADKLRDAKAKLHAKVHAAAAAVHSSGSHAKAQGFTTGGNKFDPLNATIP